MQQLNAETTSQTNGKKQGANIQIDQSICPEIQDTGPDANGGATGEVHHPSLY